MTDMVSPQLRGLARDTSALISIMMIITGSFILAGAVFFQWGGE